MRNTLNKYEFCGGDPIFTFPPKTKSHLQIPEEKGGHGEAPNSFQVAKNLKDSNAEGAEEFKVRVRIRQFGENALMQHGWNRHSRGSSLRATDYC